MKYFYIDCKNGEDFYDGSLKKPYRSLEKAQSEIRQMRLNTKESIVVYLREGSYVPKFKTIYKPLFNLLDDKENTYPHRVSSFTFGALDCNITYKAFENEKVDISGGLSVTEWELYDSNKNIYRAMIPSGIEVRHFFINQRRAQRTRMVNHFFENAQCYPNSYSENKPSYIIDDLSILGWSNIDKVEFVYPNSFTMARCTVDRVEKCDNKVHIYMKQPGWHYITHKYGTSVKFPKYIENVFELLNNAGEWYADGQYIYYIPLENEDLKSADAFIPVIDRLIYITGENQFNKAENIRFEGVNFNYTGWLRPNYSNGHCDSQNNYIREVGPIEFDCDSQGDATIEIEYSDHISFENCKFAHMGTTAIRITKSSCNNLISGCEFYDISGGGITLGDPGFRNAENQKNHSPKDKTEQISNNRIVNNYLHHIAVEFMSAAAISTTYTIDTQICNNEIRQVPYSGLHIGYGWGVIQNSCTSGMQIKRNVVDIFMAELFDGGGMYFIGPTNPAPEKPNVIEENFIRNQIEPKYGGLYFDEGSTNWTARKNVFENTEMWCHISGVSPLYVHDINVVDNFVSDGYGVYNPYMNQKNITLEEPQRFPNAMWSTEVEAIIENAGLIGSYKKMFKDYDKLGSFQATDDFIHLRSGEQCPLSFIARTVRGIRIKNISNILYNVDNDNVACILDDGAILAKNYGKCLLSAIVEVDGVRKESTVNIYVDDIIENIEISIPMVNMIVGSNQKISVLANSKLGICTDLKNADIISFNQNILEVVGDEIRAISAGEGIILAKFIEDNNEFQTQISIAVLDKPTFNMIKDASFWNVSDDINIYNSQNSIEFKTDGGIGTAIYSGKTYQNEKISFDLILETKENELVCIYLRNQNTIGRAMDKNNSGYVVVINTKHFELHRFNNSERTVFYGDLEPNFTSIFGGNIPNKHILNNQICHVEIEITNVVDGVNLKMIVSDTVIFDCLDHFDGCIKESGYFGISITQGRIFFTNMEAK